MIFLTGKHRHVRVQASHTAYLHALNVYTGVWKMRGHESSQQALTLTGGFFLLRVSQVTSLILSLSLGGRHLLMVPRLVPGLKLSLSRHHATRRPNGWKVEAALEERGEGESWRRESMLVETEHKEDFSDEEERAGKE